MQGKFRLRLRLRPAAAEPLRQLPDALQRRRHQRPDAARRRGWCRPLPAAGRHEHDQRARPRHGDRRRAVHRARPPPTRGRSSRRPRRRVGQVNAAADADVPPFHNVNLFTKRTQVRRRRQRTTSATEWGVDANVRPEHKDGLKPMGTVSRNTGGDISTIIPDRIDTDHNQVEREREFQGHEELRAGRAITARSSRTTSPSMSWQNWATGPTGTPGRSTR